MAAVATKLAADSRIVIPDSRGYGDSAKPAATAAADRAQQSKRAMAADLVALMRSLARSASPSSATTSAGHFLAEELPDETAALLSAQLLH